MFESVKLTVSFESVGTLFSANVMDAVVPVMRYAGKATGSTMSTLRADLIGKENVEIGREYALAPGPESRRVSVDTGDVADGLKVTN